MNNPNQNIWRRGQFVLGPRPLERLASWNQDAVGPALHLTAHPALGVTQARSDLSETTGGVGKRVRRLGRRNLNKLFK